MTTPNITQSRKRLRDEFCDKYPNFVFAARKKIHLDQPESSASTTHDNHVIFFEPFMWYLMNLDDQIYIQPKHWAKAFMEHDLHSIADCLSRAIFTPQEIEKRNRRGVQDGLPSVKKLVIMRATKWMMNKNQDPWSFEPNDAFVTPEEQDIIEQVFENVDNVFSSEFGDIFSDIEVPMEVTSTTTVGTSNSETPVLETASITDVPMQVLDPHSTEDTDKQLEEMIANLGYTKTYNEVGKLGWLGFVNSARAAGELTKVSFRSNTDIFVDAVQFSKGRWAKAFQQRDIVSMAEVLFRKYWKTECETSVVSSLDDLCPVRRLAILRAVAWMKTLKSKEKIGPTEVYDFHSSVSEHNVYLSKEEVKQIEEQVFMKYLGISPCSIGAHPQAPISVAVEVSTENGISLAHPLQTFQNLNVSQQQSEVPSQSVFVAEPVLNFVFANDNFDTTSRTVTVIDQNSNASSSSASSSGIFVNQTGVVTMLCPRIDSNYVVVNEFRIAVDDWEEAFRNFRDQKNDATLQAGKFLFEKSFTLEEMQSQTLCGRGGRGKLCRKKIDGIFDSLSIMESMNNLGLQTLELQGQGIPIQNRTKEELQTLTRKIFTEHRNYVVRNN